jgi:CRISPR/Cas system-associated endoribonuclease Cas2
MTVLLIYDISDNNARSITLQDSKILGVRFVKNSLIECNYSAATISNI